jgi:hypothetical protein
MSVHRNQLAVALEYYGAVVFLDQTVEYPLQVATALVLVVYPYMLKIQGVTVEEPIVQTVHPVVSEIFPVYAAFNHSRP